MKEYVLRLTEEEHEALKSKIGGETNNLQLDSVRIKLNRMLPNIIMRAGEISMISAYFTKMIR